MVAKGLILKGDQQLELVLLCAAKPTVAMLKDVAEKLMAQLEVEQSALLSLPLPFSLFYLSVALSLSLSSDRPSQTSPPSPPNAGAAAGYLHSEPVSGRRSHRRDQHQDDAHTHRLHDVAHLEDGGRRRRRGPGRRCVQRRRRSVWCFVFSACRRRGAPLTWRQPKPPTSRQLSGAGTVSRECLLSDESGSAFCDGRTLAATLAAPLSIHVLKFSPIFKFAHLHVPNAKYCTLGTGCSKTDHKIHKFEVLYKVIKR